MPGLTLEHTLSGHTDVVWCAAWSPSGRALATCGGDKQIRIWMQDGEDATGPFVCKQTHSRTVRWVSWSPCGKFLASAGFDGLTGIWENQQGEFECVATLEGHENEVKCVAWARGGSMLATCSRDKSVWIWAADADKEFECLSVLNGHTQDVKMAKWHPTLESVLVSASYDNTIKVWTEEDDDWYCTETLNGHTSTVWSLAFDRDGTRMASCSDDKTILVWARGAQTDDAATAAFNGDANTTHSKHGHGAWRVAGALVGAHSRCVYTVDWSREGLIASGGADDAICIFGPPQAATTASAEAGASAAPAPAAAVSASSGPSPLTTPPADLALLHTQSGAHSGDVNCVSWNPTHPSLLCSAGDDGFVKIWRLT